jgi:hypothetical protein
MRAGDDAAPSAMFKLVGCGTDENTPDRGHHGLTDGAHSHNPGLSR